MEQRRKIYNSKSVVIVNQALKKPHLPIHPITPYIVASGIDGIFSVYATYGLVHMYINNTNLGSTVSNWYVEKSTNGTTWVSMRNPKDLTNGYYSFGTTYILDHDFSYNTKYHYRLSYKPISSSTLVITGLVTLTVPQTISDTFAAETKFPAASFSQSGVYSNIYTTRDRLRTSSPIDYKLAFHAYLNQDHTGTRRAYNSTLSGTYHNYLSLDSTTWRSTWSGLSQANFESLLNSISAIVNTGGYIHYLTNDGIIKDRMLSAWRSFMSGLIAHSGQYAFNLDMYEGALGAGLFCDGYNAVYGYITQSERDQFAQVCYNIVSGYRYGNAADSNGFDVIAFGDTHSNEDTGILLRTFGSLLYGTLSSSTLRAKISGIFYSNLSSYTTHMGQLDAMFLNDRSGGSTPYAGEYEFNEPGRILTTMHAMQRMGYIDYFTYSGWVNRAKYTAFMQYPNGRVVNTGDGGFLYLNPNAYSLVDGVVGSDTSIIKNREQALYDSIESNVFNYDFTHKTYGVLSLNSGLSTAPDSYGLDWYGKNKGMLISRSSWDDDAVILQVLAPRHQHFDKLSYDDGSFTIYYKGYQIPRAGVYDSTSDNHDNNYRKRTYAGNTITIYQSGELIIDNVYDPGVTTPGIYPVRPNNGDQPIRRLITNYTDYNTIDRRHGNTLYHSIQSGMFDITYLRCDLSPAYWRYTSSSNYQDMFPKKAYEVSREFFFVKPSGIVVIDRVVTTNSGYVQKNIVHFEKEPTIGASFNQTIVAPAGISGSINLYAYLVSGITAPFESGCMYIKFYEPAQPIHLYKIGGIGYEYWDSISGVNRPPTVYNAGTTGTYDDTEYGRGKWRIEWTPSGYTTTGLYAWGFVPMTSGMSSPDITMSKLAQFYPNDTRSYLFNNIALNTNATPHSGILNSRYTSAGISGHLFVGLYPRTDFTFSVQNLIGTVTYQTYTFTSKDMDYSFCDLEESTFSTISSGYQMIIPTGLSPSTSYRYLLTPGSTAARNEVSLSSSLQATAGLQLWLESDNLGYTYNTNITGWIDKSSNAYAISGVYTRAYPIMKNMMRTGNYHSSAHFGGHTWGLNPATRTPNASGYLELASNSNIKFSTGKGHTVFVVYYPQITSASHRQRLVDKGVYGSSTQREYMIEVKDGVLQAFVRSSSGGTQNHTLANAGVPLQGDTIRLATLHIPNNVFESPVALYDNGLLLATSGLLGTLNTAGTSALAIGNTPDGTTGYVGDIYAIMIYNSGLTNPQISGVWSYLATKYNIAMSGYLS